MNPLQAADKNMVVIPRKAKVCQGQHKPFNCPTLLDSTVGEGFNFWLSPLEGSEEFKLEAHEIEKTIYSVLPLDHKWLYTFPHFMDVTFQHKAGPIHLILGMQYSHLHAENEIPQGLPFEPVGKRTRLGLFCDRL